MGAYANRILTDGAVFAHPLDDDSGNPRNVVPSGPSLINPGGANAPTQGVAGPGIPGETDKAAQFDGTTVMFFYQAASEVAYQIGTGDYTVEAWVKDEGNTTDFRAIVRQNGSTSGNIILRLKNDAEVAQAFGGGLITGDDDFSDQAWRHVAFVRSGTNGTLYVNGISDGTATGQADVVGFAAGAEMHIGLASGGSERFRGRIAWLAGYDTALDQSVLRYHYLLGSGGLLGGEHPGLTIVRHRLLRP